MKIAVFAIIIVATQVGCTWWAVREIDRLLSPVYYNTSYTKFAVDDWENGKRSVLCRTITGDPDIDAVLSQLPATH